MIIKGKSRGNASQLGAYLEAGELGDYLENQGENERVELKDIRGLVGLTARDAIEEMGALATGARTTKPFYHAQINPEPGEIMTPERWRESVDTLEKALGFEGQPRVVVHHLKKDREHAHVVWLRVDLDRMRAIPDSHNFRKHEEVARDLECRFGHDRVQGAHVERDDQPRPDRRPYDYEAQRGERTGLSPDEAKAWVQTLKQATDSGKAFKAALESQGWIMAHGKRGHVLVDPYGSVSTVARLTGERAADVRAFLHDVPLEGLPTAEQAQKQQRGLYADRAAHPSQPRDNERPGPEAWSRDGRAETAWQDKLAAEAIKAAAKERPEPTGKSAPEKKPEPELGKDAGNVRMVWSLSKTGSDFVRGMEERGYLIARVSREEAEISRQRAAFVKEIGNFTAPLAEGELVAVNKFGGVTRINPRATGDTRDTIAQRLGGIDRPSLMNVTDATAVLKEVSALELYARQQTDRPLSRIESVVQNGMDIAHVSGAGVKAMDFGGKINIARATAADIEQLRTDHAERMRETGKDWKPPRMQEGDLFAVTSNGRVHRLNPYKLDFQAIEQRHADERKLIGSVADTRVAMAEKTRQRHAARETRRAFRAEERAYENSPFMQGAKGAKEAGKEAGLTVRDAATNVTQRLTGFVAGLLSEFLGGGSIKASYSTESPTERAAAYKAQRLSRDALRSIRDSIDRDEPLRADDVRNLAPDILENIRARGDAALMDQIRRMDEDRTRAYERGRTREF